MRFPFCRRRYGDAVFV